MASKGWDSIYTPIGVNVVPTRDTKEHVALPSCWCKPDAQFACQCMPPHLPPTFKHHSADRREYEEAAHEVFMRWLLDKPKK